MRESKICAYADILGYKNIVHRDLNGAIQLIADYQEILRIKKDDEMMFKKQYDKEDINLKTLFENSIIDSFDYFIPFSDCFFIIASNISKFIMQISNFFVESFIISGYQYDDSHTKQRNDLLQISSKTKWYPLLFKGGVSFGECVPLKIHEICESKLMIKYNLTGRAVSEAVHYQQIDKGPRLFCTRQFYNAIPNNDTGSKQIVIPVDHDELYEILWPMPYVCREGINGYRKLLEMSVNLWLYFNHEDFGIVYFKLLELVIKSIFQTYKTDSIKLRESFDLIKSIFEKKSIAINKIDRLLEHYALITERVKK